MSARFPGRKFSFLRLIIASALTVIIGAGGLFFWTYTENNQFTPERWFGGYADVTATPQYAFESNPSNTYKNTLLSFIVAHQGECVPSWGGYYTLPEAAQELDLDRKIQRLERAGQETIVSFGGLLNETLAAACPDADALANAYLEVLDRYNVSVIDLDIEADDLSDSKNRMKRVDALAKLQAKLAAEDRQLSVWLTLPADRDGLTGQGISVISEYLEADVVLAGVNLMVMNFGVASAETSQSDLAIESLNSAHAQLQNQYWMLGKFYSDEQIWRRLGATPMIGQNDHQSEVFTLKDAQALHAFSEAVLLGRTSFWSLNRDRECESNYPSVSRVADFCSGVTQTPGEFAKILSEGITGSATDAALDAGTEAPVEQEIVVDDPATSPYPIWNELASYTEGSRVVWHGNVYIALWWNKGEQPDLPVDGGKLAWRLIGPVMPGEKPIETVKLPVGFYAAWDPGVTYHRGDRVMQGTIAYEAKWWTEGDSPDASDIDPGGSPWEPLSEKEITKLLKPEHTA